MRLSPRLKVILILVVLIGIGVPVYFLIYKQKVLNLIVPEVKKIILIRADLRQDTAVIEVTAIVENKAPYRMDIDSIVCELGIGGTTLVSTSQYVGLRQESGQSDTVQFGAKIPISHTRNKILSLQDQDSTGLAFYVSIIYSDRKLNFVRGKQIEVPVPPQFKVVKTEKKKLKLFKKDVKVDLFLRIINEGKNLSLDIHDLQYKMRIGNDLTTRGKFGKDISIRPQSSQMIMFPLDIKMKQPLKTIMKVWGDNDRVPFHMELSGYLDVGKMKRIPVVIFASGRMEIVNEQKKKAEKKSAREDRKEERQDKREDKKEQRQEKREDRRSK